METVFVDTVKGQVKRLVKRMLFPRAEASRTNGPKRRQEWSIGIYAGDSPFTFRPLENIKNPVLTRADVSDVPALFVADPFMLKANQTWYLFFEVMNDQSGKGEIGLAISENAAQWVYQRIVLAEPFHLSYPYVFTWEGNYYMIPESYQANSVRLYKALQFPTQWSYVGTLLHGPYYADPSIFRYRDKWWLFVETNPEIQHDTLRLYYADDLSGPWLEHPMSPVIRKNAHIARPAGRVLALADVLVRYTQACLPVYGTQVWAFEITELTVTRYAEQAVGREPILTAGGSGWNEGGMHHIDSHRMEDGRWVACVDGWFWHDVQTMTAST